MLVVSLECENAQQRVFFCFARSFPVPSQIHSPTATSCSSTAERSKKRQIEQKGDDDVDPQKEAQEAEVERAKRSKPEEHDQQAAAVRSDPLIRAVCISQQQLASRQQQTHQAEPATPSTSATAPAGEAASLSPYEQLVIAHAGQDSDDSVRM